MRLYTQAFICLLLHAGPTVAEITRFTVSPQKCVTLNQGDVCYQTIRAEWHSSHPANVCLRLRPEKIPLKCWLASRAAVYEFEFAARETTLISLIDQDSLQSLQTLPIEVKWVYQSRQRGLSWRLF